MSQPTQTQATESMHVLAGVDGGPAGWAALRQAADLARRIGAHLDVVHIVTVEDLAGVVPTGWGAPPVPLNTPEELAAIERTVQGLEAESKHLLHDQGVHWAFHSGHGDPERVLSELAEQTDAYCIVVGTRGEGFGAFLERLVRPSVSRALIKNRQRPVLVVGAETEGA